MWANGSLTGQSSVRSVSYPINNRLLTASPNPDQDFQHGATHDCERSDMWAMLFYAIDRCTWKLRPQRAIGAMFMMRSDPLHDGTRMLGLLGFTAQDIPLVLGAVQWTAAQYRSDFL